VSSTRIGTAALSSPANVIALGAGLGLAPKAPGTFGTLLGIPLLFLMPENLWAYAIVLVALFALGVWCCDACAKNLKVHDHPGIVWDEVVGYLITMMAVPRSAFISNIRYLEAVADRLGRQTCSGRARHNAR